MGKRREEIDLRRMLTLIAAIGMLSAALAAYWFSDSSSGTFFSAALGRVGLVLAALWLAWPSLKRPAKWLPASVPVIGVCALIVIAAQPRLILPAIPLVGALITLSTVISAMRKKPKR
ncbi:hypothetical protein [Roseiconus lacunae]|uniref:hypothetical protein n=1 Tax=Roseiconus lacunae TaxID=2605694 RepID=UPI001E3C4B89|nr:hypothetical protein [Roseiconus lacunae]MCD0461264.1 hypothetical protein [Roseiconus lacunae]